MRALLRMIYRFGGDRRGNIAIIFRAHAAPQPFICWHGADLYAGFAQAGAAGRGRRRRGNRGSQAGDADAERRHCRPKDRGSRLRREGEFSGSDLGSVPTITVSIPASSGRSLSYYTRSRSIIPVRSRQPAWPINGLVHGAGLERTQYQLLFADGRLAVHGDRRDPDRHRQSYQVHRIQVPVGRASQNCGFACHETNIAHDGGTKDNLAIARANSITLRIDLVTSAVNQLLNSWSNCPQSGVSGGSCSACRP